MILLLFQKVKWSFSHRKSWDPPPLWLFTLSLALRVPLRACHPAEGGPRGAVVCDGSPLSQPLFPLHSWTSSCQVWVLDFGLLPLGGRNPRPDRDSLPARGAEEGGPDRCSQSPGVLSFVFPLPGTLWALHLEVLLKVRLRDFFKCSLPLPRPPVGLRSHFSSPGPLPVGVQASCSGYKLDSAGLRWDDACNSSFGFLILTHCLCTDFLALDIIFILSIYIWFIFRISTSF